ncbi:hypothetical protein [Capnocytophaga endodontalis]|jgi:hypothetical protein|uniref:Uncharacterized protein n=1 Tax=Capnocytophaga endodontalis TaxID=2708117 RepID=A0A1Z4BSN4_9FLAO|nr:hypothetical protein [Capnocytophaga endodontalis]ASF44253.1 hypothetical protein CBG49_14750 [Capnocytophaga endodontalis]
MNKNFKYNLQYFLLLWLLFVCTYESLAYLVNSISSIISNFCTAISDSFVYLFSDGSGKDTFLVFLSKTAFFFPFVFLLVIPIFLEKKKGEKSYFYYYNIERESYYLLIDIITLVTHIILLILSILFSFGIITSLPLFLLIVSFRIYQYKKKLIFKE